MTNTPRMTPQRAAVLAAVQEADEHLTAQEVYDRVRQVRPGIAVATVYNALGYLCEAGKVQSARIVDGPTLYERNVTHHHHLVCRTCGRVRDIGLHGMERALDDLARETGYTVERADITFTGVCPTCRR